MASQHVEGLIVRFTGHQVWVDSDGKSIPCHLRGRLRKDDRAFRVVAGDRVCIRPPQSAGAFGTIEEALPRRTYFSRYVGGRKAGERVIVANLDRLIVVTSVKDPPLSFGFLDRVLVSAERGRNETHICLNKVDLVEDQAEIDQFESVYRTIGYPIFRASAQTGEGIDSLRALFAGGVYALVGQSGVGKSSLLNRIDPALGLRVAGVAEKTGRGRHTTTFSQLYPLGDGYVADTPGMQTFGFPGTERSELSACFPEFRALETQCRFQPCTHSHEPECAVKAALAERRIFASRYQGYSEMLAEVEERERNRWS